MSNLTENIAIPDHLQPVLSFIDTQVENAVSRKSTLINFKPVNKIENGLVITGTYTIDYQYVTATQRIPTIMRIGFKDGEVFVQLDNTNYDEPHVIKFVEDFILTDLKAVKRFLRRLNANKKKYELTDYFFRYPLRGGAFAAIKQLFMQKFKEDNGMNLIDFFESNDVISIVQMEKKPEDQIYKYVFSSDSNSKRLCNVTIIVDYKNQQILEKSFIDPTNTIKDKHDYDDATLISIMLKRGFKN